MKITKKKLRQIIREAIAKKKRTDSANQEWKAATPENMMLQDDKWQQWGGWPEGEYDPPVTQQLRDYYKKMGLMEKHEADPSEEEEMLADIDTPKIPKPEGFPPKESDFTGMF
jgi:hypothetical protein